MLCCSVHVRQTDKVGTEAVFRSIEEYMTHVKEWYDQCAITTGDDVDQQRVFLATDDPQYCGSHLGRVLW